MIRDRYIKSWRLYYEETESMADRFAHHRFIRRRGRSFILNEETRGRQSRHIDGPGLHLPSCEKFEYRDLADDDVRLLLVRLDRPVRGTCRRHYRYDVRQFDDLRD